MAILDGIASARINQQTEETIAFDKGATHDYLSLQIYKPVCTGLNRFLVPCCKLKYAFTNCYHARLVFVRTAYCYMLPLRWDPKTGRQRNY